jgi:hypothetical protein
VSASSPDPGPQPVATLAEITEALMRVAVAARSTVKVPDKHYDIAFRSHPYVVHRDAVGEEHPDPEGDT